VLHHHGRLDPDRLAAAAEGVVGQHDFTAFTPTDTQHVFFHRTVTRCRWEPRGDELVLCVEADAFLRHMVRVLVGTMLMIGRGTWPPERLAELLEGAPRSAAGPTAPAHALTLVAVRYPEDGAPGPRAILAAGT
jgi:tRNA pseudouridine38-40 synthase